MVRRIEDEAVVRRYRATPRDPDGPPMHVDFDPLWQIAFSGPNSVNGKSVIDTLDKIYTYIDTRVFGLLGRFL
jgi:hypothetical protein